MTFRGFRKFPRLGLLQMPLLVRFQRILDALQRFRHGKPLPVDVRAWGVELAI